MTPHILVVEDEPELLQALRIRLIASGFSCETAENGKEGLTKLSTCQPDLIIADLLMPEMDGYEMCQRLKSDARTASIPVVVLTAVPERGLERQVYHLGAASIMHKPFESGELIATVRDVLATTTRGGTPNG